MLHRILLLAALLALPDVTLAQATPQSNVQSRKYFFKEAAIDLPFELYVPSTYTAGTPLPLIVALHGNGSNPKEMIYIPGLVELAEARRYIVVAPMGLNEHAGYGSRGPGRGANYPEDPENAGELSERDVFNVVELIQKEYAVDTRRVYLLGHSMGASGSLYLGIKYPDKWAGLALVAPGSSATDRDRSRYRRCRSS
jgi:polyhydroxybutyrate depolymerase